MPGMVLRDHKGSFIEGKNMRLKGPNSVFETETIGVHEVLSWVFDRFSSKIIIESDSLLTV